MVEDQPANLTLLVRVLERLGYRPEIAHNGVEAVTKAAEFRPNLVLMDLHMPGMDGFEATKRILATASPEERPVIIAVTAFATNEARERCLSAGVSEFLTKPVFIPSLKEALRRHLAVKSGKVI